MLFSATLTQMIFLFLLIAIGYILARFKVVPENTESILSKLENNIFIPALVLGIFIGNFTVDKLSSAKNIIIASIVIELIVIPLAILISRLAAKDKYTRNIFTYGLSFSNFSFMGNAVVSALFPEIFMEYIIFTLVLWTFIYLWGVPALLMGSEHKNTIKERLKVFLNPMFISMAVGIVLGLTNAPIPEFTTKLIDSLSGCMSPIAMLLTGMTVSRSKLIDILKIKSVYAVTFVRLIVLPLAFLAILRFVPMNKTIAVCTLCTLAMPLGLNTIVIPASYGKDTKVASSMAIISHLLSCITIPLILQLI